MASPFSKRSHAKLVNITHALNQNLWALWQVFYSLNQMVHRYYEISLTFRTNGSSVFVTTRVVILKVSFCIVAATAAALWVKIDTNVTGLNAGPSMRLRNKCHNLAIFNSLTYNQHKQAAAGCLCWLLHIILLILLLP